MSDHWRRGVERQDEGHEQQVSPSHDIASCGLVLISSFFAQFCFDLGIDL